MRFAKRIIDERTIARYNTTEFYTRDFVQFCCGGSSDHLTILTNPKNDMRLIMTNLNVTVYRRMETIKHREGECRGRKEDECKDEEELEIINIFLTLKKFLIIADKSYNILQLGCILHTLNDPPVLLFQQLVLLIEQLYTLLQRW